MIKISEIFNHKLIKRLLITCVYNFNKDLLKLKGKYGRS
jgi:hypothetical protein